MCEYLGGGVSLRYHPQRSPLNYSVAVCEQAEQEEEDSFVWSDPAGGGARFAPAARPRSPMTFSDKSRGERKTNIVQQCVCVYVKKRFHQFQANCFNRPRLCLHPFLLFLVFSSVVFFHIFFLFCLSSLSIFFVPNLHPPPQTSLLQFSVCLPPPPPLPSFTLQSF